MKTFVIRGRVSDGREFEYERHTETAREALKSWFKGVRGNPGHPPVRRNHVPSDGPCLSTVRTSPVDAAEAMLALRRD